jgi:anti-sigma factor RsiW
MSGHEPNQDMLSAFADGVLSPDAVRSMEQHLASCDTCARALDAERRFIAQLDSLAGVEPPADFVNAVMGRVAQHPAHQPGNTIPWRAAMRYGVAAALVLAVLLGGGVTWMLGTGTLQNAEPGAVVAVGISRTAGLATSVFAMARHVISQGFVLLEAGAQLVWRITLFAASSGWMVQLTLLILTVSLNYAFTRLVLNYQRRHRLG